MISLHKFFVCVVVFQRTQRVGFLAVESFSYREQFGSTNNEHSDKCMHSWLLHTHTKDRNNHILLL